MGREGAWCELSVLVSCLSCWSWSLGGVLPAFLVYLTKAGVCVCVCGPMGSEVLLLFSELTQEVPL